MSLANILAPNIFKIYIGDLEVTDLTVTNLTVTDLTVTTLTSLAIASSTAVATPAVLAGHFNKYNVTINFSLPVGAGTSTPIVLQNPNILAASTQVFVSFKGANVGQTAIAVGGVAISNGDVAVYFYNPTGAPIDVNGMVLSVLILY